ncbi:MAG: L-threonylcarbamoyladenylate synthase [Caldilineaceae bacterium]
MNRALTLATELIRISPTTPEPDLIAKAAAILQRGGLVAFPTETVYGLGADALNPQAVQLIFAAKERPANDPLIVHIADVEQLAQVACNVPSLALELARCFWPGALTLILPKAEAVPPIVTAGGPTVAVRCPNHPVALSLIRAAGAPIAAPSANRFSHTSPTTAQHVLDDLAGRIDLILDGGPTAIGVESTVLDVTGAQPRILRPGGVTAEALAEAIGASALASAPSTSPPSGDEETPTAALLSPGLLDRHYAPHTPLWLFTQACLGDHASLQQAMLTHAKTAQHNGGTVAFLLADEDLDAFANTGFRTLSIGSLQDLDRAAAHLFSTLRSLDTPEATLLLARDFPARGLGLAIRDRLRRAADRVIDVSTNKNQAE